MSTKNKEIPHCGFAVTPLYPVGTRLHKFFPGLGTFAGRVTSFNGEIYEISYDDGDEECFDASGFDNVEIVETLKRPTRHKTPKNTSQEEKDTGGVMEQLPINCPICTNRFSGDPSDKENADRLPVQANHCAHVICKDCVQKIRLSTSTKTIRKMIDCPICKQPKSFNADQPTVCLTMCEMVQFCHTLRKRAAEKKKKEASERSEKRKRHEDMKEKNAPERSAKRNRQGPLPDQLVSSSFASALLLECSCCKISKIRKKFSTKQWQRGSRLKPSLCRRCEEKDAIRKAGGDVNQSTRILVASREGSETTKFLATVVTEHWTDLPRELTLDGYTREEWSLYGSSTGQEGQWQTARLRCAVVRDVSGFLEFLRQHRKAAYGTFVQETGVDGFFVVPFDQPASKDNNSFSCKYVLGLGLVGPRQQPRADTKSVDNDPVTSSTLGRLLAAQRKTDETLAVVPKGSVKAAATPMPQKFLRPTPSGVQDWFRARTSVVVEQPDLVASSAFWDDDKET